MDCLDEQTLAEFLRGKVPRERMVEIGDHVTVCPRCKDLLRKVAGRSFSSLGELFDDEDTYRRVRPPDAGRVVGGRFRIVKMLGEGAMGVVYEAHDQLLDTEVALKFLKSALTNDSIFIRRVKREILVSRRITHPNVARVYDLWTTEDGGQSYIQMELLSGETLDAVLKRGPLAPALAASLLMQIAGALEAAHKEGVVHRDLKPSNMMVDGSGKLTVTDFGLASDLRSDGNLSIGAGPIGTPAYWAPEQARCEAVTPASDVFSFGVLAHYLLTHEFPAIGTTLTKSIPPRLRPILERCLDAKPERRYPSGAELMQALQQAKVAEPARRGPWLPVGVAAAFVVGVGIALFAVRPGEPRVALPPPPPLAPVPMAVAAGPDAAVAVALPDPPTPSAARPDAAVVLAVVEPPKPRHRVPAEPKRPSEAGPDAGVAKAVDPAPVPTPVPEAPKVDVEALAKLRERLGRVEGSLMARHVRAQDLDQYPETVAAARSAIAAGKVDDAGEAVSRAEAIAGASKVDQAFIDRKTKRLSKLRREATLDAAIGKAVDDNFVEASRAFFKRDYVQANERLEAVQKLLEKR